MSQGQKSLCKEKGAYFLGILFGRSAVIEKRPAFWDGQQRGMCEPIGVP